MNTVIIIVHSVAVVALLLFLRPIRNQIKSLFCINLGDANEVCIEPTTNSQGGSYEQHVDAL
jgi:predicted alpha/beta hydrolase family esterase